MRYSLRTPWLLAAECVTVAMCCLLSARQVTAAWQMGKPIVTYWNDGDGTTFLTPEIAQHAVQGGYNVVWVNGYSLAGHPTLEQQMATAQQYGLRTLLKHPLLEFGDPNNAGDAAQIDILVNRYKAYPSTAYSYFVKDAPRPSDYARLHDMVSLLRSRDPNRMSYININYHIYTEDSIANYVSNVSPSLISYDKYNFKMHPTTGQDVDEPYFYDLATVSQGARQTGLPFLNHVQACAWVENEWRIPQEGELRFLVYTTLAYGGEGISYFTYQPVVPNSGGLEPAPDGTPTAVYTALTPLNRQFVNVVEEVRSLTSIGAYHLGDLPPGTTMLPANSPFTVSPPVPISDYQNGQKVRGMVLGFFGPDSDLTNATFAMVVNLDYDNNKVTTVTGPGNLTVFDATTNTWTPTGSNQATLNLLPGGGVLVALASAIVPGDFDRDGDVDGADFVVWQTNFPDPTGATRATGDADGDGDVDGADFVVWQTHFPTGAGASASPVPESPSIVLALFGGLLVGARQLIKTAYQATRFGVRLQNHVSSIKA